MSVTLEKLMKVASLALCQTALSGEQDTASYMFFKMLRNQNVQVDGFVKLIVEAATKSGLTGPTLSAQSNGPVIMPFGKYRGKPVSEMESRYMIWCIETVDRLGKRLYDAMKTELLKRGYEECEIPNLKTKSNANGAKYDKFTKQRQHV